MKSIAHALVVCSLIACSNTPAPRAPSDNATETTSSASAAEPNKAKVIAHFREHVKYPASRSDVLAACAQTSEFSGPEKQWLALRLPEGTYKTPDEVVGALHL